MGLGLGELDKSNSGGLLGGMLNQTFATGFSKPLINSLSAGSAEAALEQRQLAMEQCNASGGYFAAGVCHTGQAAIDIATKQAESDTASSEITDKANTWLEEHADEIDENNKLIESTTDAEEEEVTDITKDDTTEDGVFKTLQDWLEDLFTGQGTTTGVSIPIPGLPGGVIFTGGLPDLGGTSSGSSNSGGDIFETEGDDDDDVTVTGGGGDDDDDDDDGINVIDILDTIDNAGGNSLNLSLGMFGMFGGKANQQTKNKLTNTLSKNPFLKINPLTFQKVDYARPLLNAMFSENVGMLTGKKRA